ncbi:MAG: NAD(P)-dependent oxidoreductase [Candidatus Omnitrophica bacterium]|nr:NAD(P)-dependent oxidoreductase [Candidatus Omnitrophota bacterium]
MGKNRKILITGSTGLLGLALIKNKPAGFDIYAGYYNFPKEHLPDADVAEYILFDIRSREEVLNVFNKVCPDIVIHTASLGNVDYCERNKEEAWRTNVEGSRNVIAACRNKSAKLVFTSSNAVFDGENAPYKETDKPNPIDYYGNTKLQTELDIAEGGIRYGIMRLITMYGWHHPLERQNPVTWVLEKLTKKTKINIVDDIYNNHLFVDNAADATWSFIKNDKEGVYHIAGSQIVSRYELTCRVADVFGLDKNLINPVNSSFFPSIAPRPKNTSYDINKMQDELSVQALDIQKGLALMKNSPPKEWKYGWC